MRAPRPRRASSCSTSIGTSITFCRRKRKGTPRFETAIEVFGKSPQIMLERFFGGVDLEYTPGGAPRGGGAPTEVEMRTVRPHPSPYADFLSLGKVLAEKLKGKEKKPERYFLYRVRGRTG